MESRTAAKVNGLPITEDDLKRAMEKSPEQARTFFASKEGYQYLLEQLIAYRMMYLYGKEQGMEQDPEYIKKLETAKRDILADTAIDRLMNSVSVSDEEVSALYEKGGSQLSPVSVEASHILVDCESKAEDIIRQINGGMKFEDAAKKYSSCPSASKGGSLGSFGKGMMVPEFEQAAFSLEEGKLSRPVKTSFGYHIIRVDKKVYDTPEEAKNRIRTYLLEDRKSKMYEDFINDLKKKYTVEIM